MDNLTEAVEHFLRREHYDGAPWFVEQSQIEERTVYLVHQHKSGFSNTIMMQSDRWGFVICDLGTKKKEYINAALQALKIPITIDAVKGKNAYFSTPWGQCIYAEAEWVQITELLNPCAMQISSK